MGIPTAEIYREQRRERQEIKAVVWLESRPEKTEGPARHRCKFELDSNCLQTLTDRLNLPETADEKTVVSLLEGVLSALVEFDNEPVPPSLRAYNFGRDAAKALLEARKDV